MPTNLAWENAMKTAFLATAQYPLIKESFQLDHMTPTKFMAEYFRGRTELILAEIERRSPHRQKYFTSDCRWDSRRGTVESSQAERILDVSEEGDEVLVVTTGSSSNSIAFPLRYHLRRNAESWLIQQVESRCPACHDSGKARHGDAGGPCPFCAGKGWK
jgi:hypothetical protein